MSEGAAAVAESQSALLKDTKYSLVALDDSSGGENLGEGRKLSSEEDEDFVVYSESTELKDTQDISHKFESNNHTERTEKSEIRVERHEVKFDGTDEEVDELSLVRSRSSQAIQMGYFSMGLFSVTRWIHSIVRWW